MDKFKGSGIREEQIENTDQYKDIAQSLLCCICLDIVKNPVECQNCSSLYCGECWDLMKIAGKKCVINCTAPVIKANATVYKILSKLKLKCDTCKRGNIQYDLYVKHLEICLTNQSISKTDQLLRYISEKEAKAVELQSEIELAKKNGIKNTNTSTPNYGSENDFMYNKDTLRSTFLTYNLAVNQKMELYNCAIEGKLSEFKSLINDKKYPILEEVSAHNYYWTPLHYAMHYGQYEIVCFIMDHLKSNNILDLALRLESNDNRCPVLCLLKSNSLNIEKKKSIVQKLFARYNINMTKEIMREMKNRDMDSILKQFKK